MTDKILNFSKNGIHEIRPKVLFKKIEESFPDNNVMMNVSIPSSIIGGMTLLESSILVTLAKLISASVFFEFGTYLGATSILLASNAPENATITTLDIPENMASQSKKDDTETDILQDDIANDNYLRKNFIENGAFYIDRASEIIKKKIHRIYHDSRTLNLLEHNLIDRFDFIFIDGGHDFATVSIDTENALRMSKEDSIIVWHDYQSTIHGEVTRFIEKISSDTPIIHVQNTMLAFMLKGKFRSLL